MLSTDDTRLEVAEMAKMAIADQVYSARIRTECFDVRWRGLFSSIRINPHFVYELLQNAEDAGASKIKFEAIC